MVQFQLELMMINFKFEACVLQVQIGWPNCAQNRDIAIFHAMFMPCSTRRHSKTCEPILKWRLPFKSSRHGLANDINNMAQMFLLAHIAESFWTQFSAKTPLSTQFFFLNAFFAIPFFYTAGGFTRCIIHFRGLVQHIVWHFSFILVPKVTLLHVETAAI